MAPPRTLSAQGHELRFACNHLGHFALTALLLGLLEDGNEPHVVTVSSPNHRQGRLFFDDLTGERTYSPMAFYNQSKLANAVFGQELHRRLAQAGSPVRSVLAHPGYTATNLRTSAPVGMVKLLFGRILTPLAQSPDQGALSQLYAATDPGVEGGQFIGQTAWPNCAADRHGYSCSRSDRRRDRPPPVGVVGTIDRCAVHVPIRNAWADQAAFNARQYGLTSRSAAARSPQRRVTGRIRETVDCRTWSGSVFLPEWEAATYLVAVALQTPKARTRRTGSAVSRASPKGRSCRSSSDLVPARWNGILMTSRPTCECGSSTAVCLLTTR